MSLKALNTGGRSDTQTEPEGCILQCLIEWKLIGGDSLRVYLPMLWNRPSTTGVYKVIENSNLTPEKSQHQSDYFYALWWQ